VGRVGRGRTRLSLHWIGGWCHRVLKGVSRACLRGLWTRVTRFLANPLYALTQLADPAGPDSEQFRPAPRTRSAVAGKVLPSRLDGAFPSLK